MKAKQAPKNWQHLCRPNGRNSWFSLTFVENAVVATYHLNHRELTDDFFKAVQLLFQGQRVKVTGEIEETNKTGAIRANPALHETIAAWLKAPDRVWLMTSTLNRT